MSTILDKIAIWVIKYPPYRITRLPKFLILAFWYKFLELDRWALSRAEFFDEKTLTNLQRERLLITLNFARRETLFWKNTVVDETKQKHQDILKSVPVLNRARINELGLNFFEAKKTPGWRRETISTSGTTTTPCVFYGDKLSFLRMEAALKQMFGLKNNNHLVRVNLKFPPFRPLGRMLLFPFYGSDEIIKRAGETFKKKVTHIFGPSSSILELALALKSKKILCAINSAAIVGEHLDEQDKILIEEVFGCPVLNIYASREAGGPLAYECLERTGWHVNMTSFFIEILDKDDKPLAENQEGYITITMFENLVMPFIRYKIGDLGFITSRLCGCGRKGPRLFFRGREAQWVILQNGKRVPLTTLVGLIRNFAPPVLQFQFRQTQPGKVVTRLVTTEVFTEEHQRIIKEESYKRFKDQLLIAVEIGDKVDGKNILFVSELSSAVDKRKRSGG